MTILYQVTTDGRKKMKENSGNGGLVLAETAELKTGHPANSIQNGISQPNLQ